MLEKNILKNAHSLAIVKKPTSLELIVRMLQKTSKYYDPISTATLAEGIKFSRVAEIWRINAGSRV